MNFIHIGKTGGSAITESIKQFIGKDTDYGKFVISGHGGKLTNEGKYIFFVRNPIDRFVSAYLSGFREGKPRYHYPWSPMEKKYFTMFPTPNQLAESLYENEDANEAMKHLRHVNTSLTHFLGDSTNIQKCKDNIIFVGTTENLSEGFTTIKKILNIETGLVTDEIKTHKTPNQYSHLKKISPKGVENIRKYYNEDYIVIEELHNLGFIDKKSYNRLIL